VAADVPALVGSAREAGIDVTLDVDGDLHEVDPAVGLCAYRIVQESLANAGHHAPGAPVTVAVRIRRCRSLDLVVRNPLAAAERTSPSGREGVGLIGMRERAAACRGDLSIGATQGAWVVEARFPLAATRS
jgi:signal transduction histidine kinase